MAAILHFFRVLMTDDVMSTSSVYKIVYVCSRETITVQCVWEFYTFNRRTKLSLITDEVIGDRVALSTHQVNGIVSLYYHDC